MDTITGMRTFCAVAQQRSFVKGADQLAMSAALASKYVGQLEQRLGARLLNRTTRSLSLTEQGRNYLSQCLKVLDGFDNLESSVHDLQEMPKGHLRISAPRALGEDFLSAAIGDFLDLNPDITMDIHLSDRFVNIVDEGFDLAIRAGVLADSTLVARKLSPMDIVICASPDYLERRGMPQQPQDLIGHTCIIDTNYKGRHLWPFIIDGQKVSVAVSGRVAINSSSSCREMALQGKGVIFSPLHVVAAEIAAGRLIAFFKEEVDFGSAIYAVYPHSQYLAAKTRAFVDFLVKRFNGSTP